MTGRSVHNTRIERLWREVGARVTGRYSQIFRALEDDEHVLDRDNAFDLYCLHHVFMPHLRHSVQLFVQSWNHHSMSTKGLGGLSPIQQWKGGKSSLSGPGHLSCDQTD